MRTAKTKKKNTNIISLYGNLQLHRSIIPEELPSPLKLSMPWIAQTLVWSCFAVVPYG